MVHAILWDGVQTNFTSAKSLNKSFSAELHGTAVRHDADLCGYFLNPISGRKVYTLFDPTHIYKNLRNTLWRSSDRKLGATKLIINDHDARWDHIVTLSKDPVALKHCYMLDPEAIKLDGWAKMRVKHANAVVNWTVIEHLRHNAPGINFVCLIFICPYAIYTNFPFSFALGTAAFLEAVHHMFRDGLLNKKPQYADSHDALDAAIEALKTFERWLEEHNSRDYGDMPASEVNKRFIKSITFGEMKMMVTGVMNYANDFWEENGTRYPLRLLRVNQSALESMFGHVGELQGGGRNFNCAQYADSLAVIRAKSWCREVEKGNHSGVGDTLTLS